MISPQWTCFFSLKSKLSCRLWFLVVFSSWNRFVAVPVYYHPIWCSSSSEHEKRLCLSIGLLKPVSLGKLMLWHDGTIGWFVSQSNIWVVHQYLIWIALFHFCPQYATRILITKYYVRKLFDQISVGMLWKFIYLAVLRTYKACFPSKTILLHGWCLINLLFYLDHLINETK